MARNIKFGIKDAGVFICQLVYICHVKFQNDPYSVSTSNFQILFLSLGDNLIYGPCVHFTICTDRWGDVNETCTHDHGDGKCPINHQLYGNSTSHNYTKDARCETLTAARVLAGAHFRNFISYRVAALKFSFLFLHRITRGCYKIQEGGVYKVQEGGVDKEQGPQCFWKRGGYKVQSNFFCQVNFCFTLMKSM